MSAVRLYAVSNLGRNPVSIALADTDVDIAAAVVHRLARNWLRVPAIDIEHAVVCEGAGLSDGEFAALITECGATLVRDLGEVCGTLWSIWSLPASADAVITRPGLEEST